MRFALMLAAMACGAVLAVPVAIAGTPLTKAAYLAKLRAANAQVSKAENGAAGSVQAKATTAAQVKARFKLWGETETRLGRSFAALTPPAVAEKANDDLSHAEEVYGAQLVAIAAKLPATKSAIARYIGAMKPPTGGALLDHAIAELKAAGFEV